MRGYSLVALAIFALSSCERGIDGQPMGRAQALDAIGHTCVQKAELRFSEFDVTMCGCARARIESEFRDDGELGAVADLARIEVRMGTTSANDFQALEQLRREYNNRLDQVSDASRRLRISTALREAVVACRAAVSP
jgi:hypothetical protein